MIQQVVVVGSSLAGVRACGGLRAEGFDGDITLIGAEPHLPYDRPPLSKKVLSGEWEPDRIALVRPEELDSLRLQLRLGTPATGLSTTDRLVTLRDGSAVPYDALVIATGAATRRLPNQLEHDSIFELRTLDDSLALRSRIDAGGLRVTIIGAGFIGLEVAATARLLGNDVVVLEGAAAPLVRGLGGEMGLAVTQLHADHGVAIRCGVQVLGIEPAGSGLVVRLGDGDSVVSDLIVVGIGVSPTTQWLEGSGLTLRDGVVCDATLNAGVPGVYAAGDIVRWPNAQFDGEEMRVEHWTNASEQGLAVARNLVAVGRGDQPVAYSSVPFFWSEQYGTRIQFIGRAAGDDDVRVVKGGVSERSFLALYGSKGRLRGALGVAMAKPVMQCRKLLLENMSFDDAIEAAAAF
ncbi:unannotated protein [freshwater metagenome]|uniref:Unannotated protein n=1 Tax=freshwater metagenome TaxID=449393 RepID=A0A6J7EYH3_9ZZZZ